jgi:NodT family efflux transporter outer membrane factor (OMF) lipoprotein
MATPLALCLLAGCAAVPDLGPKPTPRGPDSIAAEQSLSHEGLPQPAPEAWPVDGWWQAYGDAQLNGLIEEGLRNSPDVAIAVARYRRAGGLTQEAGAAGLPSLDVRGSAALNKQSYNNGFPKEFVPQGWQDTGEVAAVFNFDIDLWGRNRALLASATSEERAAAIDAQQARLLIATGIASAYVDLARLYEERDIRQESLNVRISSQKLVSDRSANGLETRGSVRQADAEVATTKVGLAEAEEAIDLRRNQIAALVGAGPDRGRAITRPTLVAVTPRGLPDNVTTDLIGRRPDVASARERVEAAASRIKVARADFFPSVNLSALIGVQSLGLDNLFMSDSTFGKVGPAISLPIFHGGALQGRYRGARAEFDEAVANYDKSVLNAYQQVADAVTSARALDARLRESQAALTASEEAYAIARKRYEGGLSTYLDVLAVEDRLLLTRRAVSDINASSRSIDIALVRALGGGFSPNTVMISKDNTHG